MGQIVNLHAIRGLAALAVVAYHLEVDPFGLHTEFMAVAVFFALSGFLMARVSSARPDDFLLRRFLRIAPLYWVTTLALVVIIPTGLFNVQGVFTGLWANSFHPHDILRWLNASFRSEYTLAPQDVVRSLLFIPYENRSGSWQPIHGVGWTVAIEMFCYVLVAGGLKVKRRYAAEIAATVLVLGWMIGYATHTPWMTQGVFNDYVLCFAAGIAVERLSQKVVMPKFLAAPICLAFLPASVHGIHPIVTAFLCGALIYAAYSLEARGMTAKWKALDVLGTASFALYLMHPFVIEFARPLVTIGTNANLAVSLTAMAVCVVAGTAANRWIEVPFGSATSRWLKALRARKSSAPVCGGDVSTHPLPYPGRPHLLPGKPRQSVLAGTSAADGQDDRTDAARHRESL